VTSALVIGANGIVGRNMIDLLCRETDWTVNAVARSHRQSSDRVRQISVDLLDRAASRTALGAIGPIDYVFVAALATGSTLAEEVVPNLELLRNSVSPLIAPGDGLRHVCLVQGTKWYGSHLGPYRTPARENDLRHEGVNFYYDQRDWLSAAQAEGAWSFSTLRPHFISGFNVGNPHNMMAALGVYAAIKRELGEALDFPGTDACFDTLSMATDVLLLNKAMIWVATTPQCANQDFNITNGDYFRWRNIWPAIAEDFGISAGAVTTLCLAEYMSDKSPVWDAIVRKHALQSVPLDKIVDWHWADFLFRSGWDDMSSTIKARRYGFTDCVDTQDDMLTVLARYRDERVLP
jgi:nucleoside-diphosphate-sugar epimerase